MDSFESGDDSVNHGQFIMARAISDRTHAADTTRFFFIAGWSTALGLGVLCAALASLSRGPTGLAMQWSVKTVVAFLIGAPVGYYYWRLVARNHAHPVADRSRVNRASILLFGVGFCAFLYPLRFVPAEKFPDIVTGLGFAALALSLGGILLWRLRTALEADGEEHRKHPAPEAAADLEP